VKVVIYADATKDAGDGALPALIACGLKTSCVVREAVMRVQVKLFASLCRYSSHVLPGIPFEVEMPEGINLSDLVDRLNLPHEEVKVFFVNGRSRPIDWLLAAGDEIGIFPLVAGG
jgi:molybdopterin converting factor small subunit